MIILVSVRFVLVVDYFSFSHFPSFSLKVVTYIPTNFIVFLKEESSEFKRLVVISVIHAVNLSPLGFKFSYDLT